MCDNVKLLEDKTANCYFEWDSVLKLGSLSIRTYFNGESMKNKKVQIKLPTLNITKSDIIINLMCSIKDTTYNHKYVFNQPVMITLTPQVEETQHTDNNITFVTHSWYNGSSSKRENMSNISTVNPDAVTSTVRWTRGTNETAENIHSAQSETSLVVFAIILLFLLIVGIVLLICYRRKGSKVYKPTGLDDWKISPSTTEMNPLYHTDESDTEENNNEESIIPQWLTLKPEMVYQPQCIEQGQALGHGQYGTVYKGKLYQGNAV